MKIITEKLSKFLKILRIIYRIERDDIQYHELINFFYGETPPKNRDFLKYDYNPFIENIVKFGPNGKKFVLFSVIIPTYNRSELLLKTLDSIIGQNNISIMDFELVIVDNSLSDETKNKIENFSNSNKNANIVYIKLKRNYGADLARNVASLNSKGNLLAFTDDDCIVPPDWLSRFNNELRANPEIMGVGGYKLPRSTREHLDIYHRFLMWKHFYYPHIRTKKFNLLHNHCGLTANVCYRRNFFKKTGGFNFYFKHIGFEEFKIYLHKTGSVLLYEPHMVEHFAYFSFREYILKTFAQGWDHYLLHVIHPGMKENISLINFIKQTARGIYKVITYRKQNELFSKPPQDAVIFSLIFIVTNLSLLFGKYWIPLKMISNARFASHDTSF